MKKKEPGDDLSIQRNVRCHSNRKRDQVERDYRTRSCACRMHLQGSFSEWRSNIFGNTVNTSTCTTGV